jgi:hypothetical protein
MFTLKASFVACSVALTALAASFPPKPEEVTVVQSTKFPGVSISFKEVGSTAMLRTIITDVDIDKHLRDH